MRFPPATLTAVTDGRVDLAFRRWDRPMARPGARQRTAVGVIGFDAVEPLAREHVIDEDARRAGFASRDELLAFLDRRATGTIYRVQLRLLGPDPRIALREARPDQREVAEIERRLARLDRFSSHGPWTRSVLEAIGAQPGLRAADLAAQFGRERLSFKVDVRKLKELGLTQSLTVGYRLSARGEVVFERLAGSARSDAARAQARQGGRVRR